MNLLTVTVIVFFAGFLENVINGWHMRSVAHGKAFQGGLSGTIYVLVWSSAWLTLVAKILENQRNAIAVLAYAIGSGLGSATLVMWAKFYAKRKDSYNETTTVENSISRVPAWDSD